MDDPETLHRRARLRELVTVTFEGRLTDLLAHIKHRTGKDANQGELSALQSDKGLKSFGDKKAKILTEQIGLPRHWFAQPLGSGLRKTEWTASQALATKTPATDTGTATPYQVQQLRPSAAAPTLEQSLEILALHINQIPESRRDAAKLLLSALVASPSLHGITAAGIASLCASDTTNAAAA